MTATTPHRSPADARPHALAARRRRAVGLLPLLLVALVGCTGTGTGTGTAGGGAAPAPSASVPAPGASGSPGGGTPGEPAPAVPSPGAVTGTSPEDAFRAWLAASRAPDVETACGYLAPALVDRMVAEMTAQGWPGITDCASMTTTTAGLYAAVGDVAEVEVTVREERPDATVLAVSYAGGDCGTAVMAPAGTSWVITEQSEEQC